MKTYWVLLALLISLGCADSTQDVAVPGGGPASPPPDTIISKDGLTVEFFGPHHPTSPAREALLPAVDDVSLEADRLFADGYSANPSGPWFAHALLPDGREAEMTWIPLLDASGSEATIVYLRVGDEVLVRSFRQCCELDTMKPGTENQRKDDPSPAFGSNTCMDMARTLYYVCVSNCVQEGGQDGTCRRSCIASAAFLFLYCLFVSS